MSQANFLKKVQKKSKCSKYKIQHLLYKASNHIPIQSISISLKREEISHFIIIGVVDRKIILTYNNKLKLFGYFDLHAVHQRIRYEYYVWKIKSEEWLISQISSLNSSIIQKKNDRVPYQAFGAIKKIMIKINVSRNIQTQKNTIWGINLEKNNINQLYITSYRLIFGREFTQQELIQIVYDILSNQNKLIIPKIIDQWIGQFSCKSAFKFNDNLKNQTAQLLIFNLAKCNFPWHCVHGRTTIHVKPWPARKS